MRAEPGRRCTGRRRRQDRIIGTSRSFPRMPGATGRVWKCGGHHRRLLRGDVASASSSKARQNFSGNSAAVFVVLIGQRAVRPRNSGSLACQCETRPLRIAGSFNSLTRAPAFSVARAARFDGGAHVGLGSRRPREVHAHQREGGGGLRGYVRLRARWRPEIAAAAMRRRQRLRRKGRPCRATTKNTSCRWSASAGRTA